MLSRDEARATLERVLDLCAATDGAEASVGGGSHALTRFTENTIHQNVTGSSDGVSVRVRVGNRIGAAGTDRMDYASFKWMVEASTEAAKGSAPDPELLPLLGPQEYREVDAWSDDATTEAFGPAERAAAVAEIVAECEPQGLKAAGSFSNGEGAGALANTEGLFAYRCSTGAGLSVTVTSDDSTGWAGADSHATADIDPTALGTRAISKALASRNPREVEARAYTVILEAEAVADMLAFIGSHFNALAVDEGRSFLSDGRLGEKVVGDNITLTSDPYHPLQRGRPYDAEGLPRKRLTLIERGVAKELAYDRLTAQKHNVEPTGHGGGGSNAYGAYPTNLCLEGGDVTIDEMVQTTDFGLWITRLHYLRTVDPNKIIITGMTRDGCLWIQGGEVKYAVKNLRFNESLLRMLSNVVMLGIPERRGSIVVPPMKVEGFHFTSGTEF
ncbi:MAG: TldD/PmbA family protein [Armatimonadota bacterium]